MTTTKRPGWLIGLLIVASGYSACTPSLERRPITLADVAGQWKVRALAVDRDTVLTTYQLWTSADTGAWKLKFDNRPDTIRIRVLGVAGDSIMIQAGPYHSVLRQAMVTTRTTLRFRDGKLFGRSTARYDGTPPDSVRVRTEGTRVKIDSLLRNPERD